MSASSQQHKSRVRTILHMAEACSLQRPRAEVAIAGATLCWHVPPAFGCVCFGVLVAACCELPRLTTPVSILPGHRGSVDTTNAIHSPCPDTAGRKGHDWWRGGPMLSSGPCCGPRLRGLASVGGQVGTMAGVQSCKEGQTYSHPDFCSMRVISTPIYGPWTSLLHHRHGCAWMWSWKEWAWSGGWCSCSSHSSLRQGFRGLAARIGPCLFALAPITSGVTASKDYTDQHRFLSIVQIQAHG